MLVRWMQVDTYLLISETLLESQEVGRAVLSWMTLFPGFPP